MERVSTGKFWSINVHCIYSAYRNKYRWYTSPAGVSYALYANQLTIGTDAPCSFRGENSGTCKRVRRSRSYADSWDHNSWFIFSSRVFSIVLDHSRMYFSYISDLTIRHKCQIIIVIRWICWLESAFAYCGAEEINGSRIVNHYNTVASKAGVTIYFVLARSG